MRTLFILTLFFTGLTCQAGTLPHHRLSIALQPELHQLQAEDQVTLQTDSPRDLRFFLHRDLHPSSPDAKITAVSGNSDNRLSQYRIVLPPGRDRFTLKYAGIIFHPPQQDIREARVFESTPGTIANEGVVLSGESGWYPRFDDGMLTFQLTVTAPPGWQSISQGKRVPGASSIAWQEDQPQDEIYLIAAPFSEYHRDTNGVDTLVYLRNADAGLAQRYLDASARYLSLYRQLIGPYPYSKFALVENFWETGYGMPSFTLLGSQVIRLPFIIDTSYPHEILHNWWGNGVYVDYTSGNWAEGFTAYLADHLLQEQKGSGSDYRRNTLQKYADFVSASRDFPLVQFTSRHSPQTEAIGYGKAMMFFHMLRRQLGDALFIAALQDFYRDYRFRRAAFADLQHVFEKASGKNLGPFFAQWLLQAGAPQLRLVAAQTRRNGLLYELSVQVEQTQPGPAYDLDVPLAVTLQNEENAYMATLHMQDKHAELRLLLTAPPLRIDLDPEFDLFRRLDKAEIPPAMSQVFGAEKLLIVLPRDASETLRSQYQDVAQGWQKQPGRMTRILWDDEIERLPGDSAVWLFGEENRLRSQFREALLQNGAMLSEGGVWLAREYDRTRHALVLTTHIGATPAAWLSTPDAAMLPGLARKLPHYAKFSYAAFSSSELTNLIKGAWPVMRSPLSQWVVQPDGSKLEIPRATLPPREALSPGKK